MKFNLKFVQINLQHAKASTALLCAKLAKQHTPIALIQEPWIQKTKIAGFNTLKSHKLFYDQCQPKPRAVIISKKTFQPIPCPASQIGML